MDLYNKTGERLFSPLTSKNKRIYVKALMLLYKRFETEWRIDKSSLIAMLSDALSDQYDIYQFDEEDDKSYNGFSRLIINTLAETKWIEYEYGENDFEEYIIIPEYALIFMEAIDTVVNGKVIEYNTYVYTTYSGLKMADTTKSDYFSALVAAYNNTEELMKKLKTLLNNIKSYHKNLSDHISIKAIAKEHFDEFKSTIADKIYHPLKTFDSVPRFKAPIIELLNAWLIDDVILDQIVKDGVKRKHFDESSAYNEVIFMMQEIIDKYHKVDGMLSIIDKKNTAYTKATVDRMDYMLNVDGSIKGKLVRILQDISSNDISSYDVFNVSSVSNLTSQSLYKPRKIIERKTGELEVLSLENLDITKEIEDLKSHIDSSYSNKKIMAYMKDLFKESDEVHSSDIELVDDDQYIKLIMSALKHDDKDSFYELEFKEDRVIKDDYIIPDMVFKKKGK
ncbi:hypothetical protein EZV73_26495 [Acidaminobacter sp. JC074]|uniref:Wadjet anti-phage system protein JetA family protein n=1 Tax=Acidaminobacter sp. JC074 TaxID=2530199 RepID=UPI001F0D8142|nr:Wadjet anti-phage system protein JetA family protein [Acidaminobacter sp. JC074]MCH4891156.1 hypothetical protein [Acidaminobacter sp. JC074]